MTVKWSELSEHERNVLVSDKVMGHPYEFKHYSTDISAAWEVVNKFNSQGNPILIEYLAGSEIWEASFDHLTAAFNAWCARAKTAPEAIALAALKAVGCDIE